MSDEPRPFEPSGFFVLRTPLLPLAELVAWGDLRERAAIRARLRSWVERPEIREGLFLASPSLDESLPAWLEAPGSERGQKVEHALVRYFSRMAGRSTPFGLFSGCSTGTIGKTTRLALEPRQSYRRFTRLDGHYLATLTGLLARDPAVRRSLPIWRNSSLYRAAGRVRYAVAREGPNGRIYSLAAASPTPHLEAALEAANGARFSEIAAAVASASSSSIEDAEAFVGEVLDAQMLTTELAPPVTGGDPLEAILEQLRPVEACARHVSVLARARAELASIDAAGLGASPDRYRSIEKELATLDAKVELARLFQVDLSKPSTELVLGEAVIDEIRRGVEVLRRLAPPSSDRLRGFKDAFRRRYEGREVPLFEALDEESGIGFERSDAPAAEASPLLKGIAFPAPLDPFRPVNLVKQSFLLSKLERAWRERARSIKLDPKELEALSPEPPPLPAAFAVFATIVAASTDAIDRGELTLAIESAGGPSGANALGRFCHTDDALRRAVEKHLQEEEARRPDVIHAEIVHLPEGRLGNIMFRPVLRKFEIPFLGRSGASADARIPVSDLLVSVVGDRVVLRSRRFGKEVAPRLTSAFNVDHPTSQGLHRFLWALAHEDAPAGFAWSWESLAGASFLPRVTIGKSILARATWNVSRVQLQKLSPKDASKTLDAVKALREELDLPRFVGVTDGDNVLPVDFDNVLSVESFVQLVKGRASVQLTEQLPGPDDLCVTGPEGRFVHEVVVPFVATANAPARPIALERERALARTFAPGSSWLYAKLYTGTSTADRVLEEAIAPLVRQALASGAAERWFFIRYGDPDWHVRVRFAGNADRLRAEVEPLLGKLTQALLDSGKIWRVQLDTYEREVERYGGAVGLELVEAIFEADSEAALALLALLGGGDGVARWKIALRGIDALLEDLGLDLEARKRVVSSARLALGQEMGAGDPFWRQLGQRLREERAALDDGLDRSKDAASAFAPALAVFARRSQRLAPIVAELRAREQSGALTQTVEQLASSIVHMHANRVLRSAHRAQETVLYYYLDRLYEGQIARRRKS